MVGCLCKAMLLCSEAQFPNYYITKSPQIMDEMWSNTQKYFTYSLHIGLEICRLACYPQKKCKRVPGKSLLNACLYTGPCCTAQCKSLSPNMQGLVRR